MTSTKLGYEYEIHPEQDYSSRLGGSWGYFVVDSPEQVDEMVADKPDDDEVTKIAFRRNGKRVSDLISAAEWKRRRRLGIPVLSFSELEQRSDSPGD